MTYGVILVNNLDQSEPVSKNIDTTPISSIIFSLKYNNHIYAHFRVNIIIILPIDSI